MKNLYFMDLCRVQQNVLGCVDNLNITYDIKVCDNCVESNFNL